MQPHHRAILPACLLLTYAALTAAPLLAALSGHSLIDAGWLTFLEIAAWCGVWAVFGRPALFHWLLLPAFLSFPADVWLSTHYGRGFSARHLGIIFESSISETLEFLGANIWPALAALLLCVAWWALTLQAARKTASLDWNGPSRRAALAALAILACVGAYGGTFGVTPTCGTDCANTAPVSDDTPAADNNTETISPYALPGWTRAPFENVEPGDIRPFGWIAYGIDFWRERHRLAALADRNRGFSFGAHIAHPGPASLVVVLVIGESGRYDRWSLNGYTHDTNPLLRKEANVVAFSDVVTPASATRLSLPVMLTRKGTLNTFRTGFPEKSLISAFREAGFKTYWLSNQIAFGDYDTPVSVFAREADVVQFMNPGGYSGVSSYDGALLGALATALGDDSPKKLIVLHTLGNHWNYALRYPAAFDRWTPSLAGLADPDMDDKKIASAISNSYDNSILYADWFLSRTIAALTSSGAPGLMLYVADHGENLHDGKCDYSMHGHNSLYDFHVPMIAWYSTAYAKAFPEKTALIKRHAAAKLSTENVFASLLDVADIRYKGEKPDWSFVSPAFRPHRRYVDSYGWADYDHSDIKGICHEIIDRGTALPRQAGPL